GGTRRRSVVHALEPDTVVLCVSRHRTCGRRRQLSQRNPAKHYSLGGHTARKTIMAIRTPAHILQPAIVLLGALACVLLGRTSHLTAAAVIPTPISQLPLTIAIPAHPQVVLAIGNSESMDGNLSGAIMTGAGSLPASMNLLQDSSSPLNYTIPAGFTPPIDPGNGVVAPYTSNSGGQLVDNSPSRLNVAKGGLTAMLAQYLPYADFALIDYKLSGTNIYTTWVYEMSPPGGFVFTNNPVAGNRYIPNPCN